MEVINKIMAINHFYAKIVFTLLIISSCFYLIGYTKKRNIKNRSKIILITSALLGLFFLWNIDRSLVLANMIGIGRGSDLIIYMFMILVLVMMFKVNVKIESLRVDLTDIVRNRAIEKVLKDGKRTST